MVSIRQVEADLAVGRKHLRVILATQLCRTHVGAVDDGVRNNKVVDVAETKELSFHLLKLTVFDPIGRYTQLQQQGG